MSQGLLINMARTPATSVVGGAQNNYVKSFELSIPFSYNISIGRCIPIQIFTKTIKLRIHVSNEYVLLLCEMTEQYRLACNHVSDYIFSHEFNMCFKELDQAMYHELRNRFGLKSQMAQSVFKTVAARYKTIRGQMAQRPFKYKDEKGKWHKIKKDLFWLWKPVHFRRPQVDLVHGRDYSFVDGGTMLSINTLEKRIKLRFVADNFTQYLDGSWKLGTGKIVELNGKWYFHIPVTKEIGEFSKANVSHVVGIDRGIRFIATTYDEAGKTQFISGKQILRKRNKFVQLRKQLQQKHTWSSCRALKRLSGRENRWMSDINHQISKTLVQKYGENTLFVIEDLAGVSFEKSNLKGTKKQIHEKRSWAFYQLEQFLTYKAQENHSKVLKVDAWGTSQRCPKCGAVHKESRHHDVHEYICENCGYSSNDDRIGAMNIHMLGTMWLSGNEMPSIKKLTASE